MKFSRFVALVTMVSISSGAYLLHAQTKSHAKKKTRDHYRQRRFH